MRLIAVVTLLVGPALMAGTPPRAVVSAPLEAQELTIHAIPILQFDTNALTVVADGAVTVHFVNEDTGISHNFAAYTDGSASQPLAPGSVGATCTAPCSNDVQFALPPQGDYFFRCDVHPTIMTGTFRVLASPATATPAASFETPVEMTPTPLRASTESGVGSLPATGHRPSNNVSESWWAPLALALAGCLLSGAGLLRARQRTRFRHDSP